MNISIIVKISILVFYVGVHSVYFSIKDDQINIYLSISLLLSSIIMIGIFHCYWMKKKELSKMNFLKLSAYIMFAISCVPIIQNKVDLNYAIKILYFTTVLFSLSIFSSRK